MPQPTNRSRLRVVCTLPWEAADRPSGWSSEATRVAVLARSSSRTVIARLYGSSGVPDDSLSKNV